MSGLHDAPGGMVGQSAGLTTAIDLAKQIAPTTVPVLVVGETGTGKELLARYVHEQSGRSGPFIDVDCGALPDDLAESLLFGHRRGAFTGAVQTVKGLVSEAEGGTLFLDELGSMSQRGQAKLLRVLETRQVRGVGATRPTPVDFRLVCTVQSDVASSIGNGSFRRDLLQRVAGMVIDIPSLRDRKGDIAHLSRHFARMRGLSVSDDAIPLLESKLWPGNVRELKWTLVRACLFADEDMVTAVSVRLAFEAGPSKLAGDGEAESRSEISDLRAACRAFDGDAEKVAASLGIGRSTLYRRLKAAGLELGAFKTNPATV